MFCEANLLKARYTKRKLAGKVAKLNVNKDLFCVKKRKYFLISSINFFKHLIINRNVSHFRAQ